MFFNQEANKDISVAQIENRFNLKVLLKNDPEHNNSRSEMRGEMWDSCLIVDNTERDDMTYSLPNCETNLWNNEIMEILMMTVET